MTVEVGDLVTAELLDLMLNPPTVHLVAQATQSQATNVTSAVVYGTGSTVLDTHDYHSESSNNTRITPTRAGIYKVNAKAFWAGDTDYLVLDTFLRMNGSSIVAGSSGRETYNSNTGSGLHSEQTGDIYVTMNGTTDYIEQLIVQTNTNAGTNTTNASAQFSSVFNLVFHKES